VVAGQGTAPARLVGQISDRIARRAVFLADRLAGDLSSQLRRASPVDTGATRASIQGRAFVSGSQARVVLEATTPQAAWTDQGTRPHVIRPVRARALVFFWPVVGRVVRFAKVNHPGFKGTRWFTNVVAGWPETGQRLLQQMDPNA
jgi:hypothetical protein